MSRATGWLAHVPLGPVAALLLGGAGGFLAWAVPARLIGKIARHLHLVELLPQAAPPYSDMTRILLALLAGLVLAGCTLLGFRRLEQGTWLWRAAPMGASSDDSPAPLRRFRRPAATSVRPPLFASELMLDEPFPEEDAPAAPPAPPPARHPLRVRALPAAPPETTAAADVDADESDGPAQDAEADPRAAEEALAPWPTHKHTIAMVDPEPAPLPAQAVSRTPPISRAPAAGSTVAELMARLEAGLARGAPQPVPAEPPLGDALREALADLQQFARR